MPQRQTRSRVALLLVAVFVVLSVVGSFLLPELVSTYWHLRNGDSTAFQGWSIPAPKGWRAFTRDGFLMVQKPLRFYDREDAAPGISVEVFRPGKPVDSEVLRQASIRAISEKGYVFQEERPIQIGTDRGYCLHFTGGKDQENIRTSRISCYLSAAHLSLHPFGP